MLSVDKDATVELGTRYYMAHNGAEYVFTARLNNINNDTADAQGVSESKAYALLGQIQRGRWIWDIQYLNERLILLSDSNSVELGALSAGAHYQFDRWKWSLTGSTRENELNDEERSYALGARYDVARGLSVNAGVQVKNSKLLPERFWSYALSLRYEL